LSAVALIALLSFLHSLYQSDKAKKLAQSREKEKKQRLGDVLYNACHQIDAGQKEIREFCATREFGEWAGIGASLKHIADTLDKISKLAALHPGHTGGMGDVLTHLLPLVRKLMNEYDLCVSHGAENITALENLRIIGNCLREVGAALDSKLSALFEGRAYNLQAELHVLESRKGSELKLS